MFSNKAEKRIGVYVCHCGGNISDYVDVEKVVEAVKNYPGVVVARHFQFMCSDAGQDLIKNDIKELQLNGVVVASCSPKLHELTFKGVLQRSGLNPYRYYHVNIREDVSWAHTHDREGATEKAIREVKAGIEYVKHAIDLEKIKTQANKSVLIVGGGRAGLNAAIILADMGIKVYLVEKEPFIGGFVSKLFRVFTSGNYGEETAVEQIKEIKKRKNIIVFTNARVDNITGYAGNFKVRIKINPRYVVKNHPKMKEAIEKCPVEVPDEHTYYFTKRKAIYIPFEGAYPEIPAIDKSACTKCGECVKLVGDAINLDQKPEYQEFTVGAVIVATGFKPYEPKEGEFGYKIYNNHVITLPQLHALFKVNCTSGNECLTFNGNKIKTITFIYCVGSRQTDGKGEKINRYCSRYCCNATLYIANELKKKFKDLQIYHLYKDIRTYGKYEEYYTEAGHLGSVFIRYPENEPPKVSKECDKIVVHVKDTLTENKELKIATDLVVLVVGMEPRHDELLEQVTKINRGMDGFYQEAHPKLKPVETFYKGVFLAGTCQAPRDIPETLSSSSAAASKAASLLLKGSIELEPSVASVDPSLCTPCNLCIEECPSEAISIKKQDGKDAAWVNEVLCIGCGACTAVCPTEAIQLKTLTTKQIYDMIKAMARDS
ncbi:MAG: CoB--CoM heterodisulfide reductase iron-sulfur subunit A family protein [Candidatus Odinarchaeota archaeon]|nr:CoB--CoM heterodisulfide reductase iron-sulfur subunit A family protein [Candidatus Odinarchaeota archaeon]